MAGYLGAPVTTTLCAAGFCSQYALHLGVSGGLGSGLAVDTLAESDAMVIGASLNEWTTHFGKILENGKKIIQIDDREDAFGNLRGLPSAWEQTRRRPLSRYSIG